MIFVIKVDETPEPWEDYSYPYCVFEGTEQQAQEHCDKIVKEHPEWLVMPVLVEKQTVAQHEASLDDSRVGCEMTTKQKLVVRCAYLDLRGALEALQQGNYHAHDWKAHSLTIDELEDAFQTLLSDLRPVAKLELLELGA